MSQAFEPHRDRDAVPDNPPSNDVDEGSERNSRAAGREPIERTHRPEPDAIPDEGGARPGTTAGDRTEDPEPTAAQRIGEARGERGLGADYREINSFRMSLVG